MSEQPDLFDRARALRTFGSQAVMLGVIAEFLQQVEPMLARLEGAIASENHQQVRQAVHFFRGGLTYLFSPAADRVCLLLDQQTASFPYDQTAVQDTFQQLESVIRRLEALFLS